MIGLPDRIWIESPAMPKPEKAVTVAEYIAQIEEPRRAAIKAIHKYDSGREGDAPIVALASQKNYISIYGCGAENGKDLQRELPKADFGKGCIRFKKEADVNLKALEKIVQARAGANTKSRQASAGK